MHPEEHGEDGNGNPFVKIGNMRVTYLAQSAWGSGPSLRFQAHKDDETNALHFGAEFRMGSFAGGFDLLSAVANLLAVAAHKQNGQS